MAPPAIKKAIDALKDKATITIAKVAGTATQSPIKKAIGAMKDKTSITIAKVAGTATQSLPEVEILVVKSTSHDDEEAALETHATIASMTRISRFHVTALAAAISKRLRKTRNPTVALKCLALLHHTVAEGHGSFADEIRAGFRGLDDVAQNFEDDHESDRTVSFLKRFAAYLDEKLKQTWLETPAERLGRMVRILGLAAALRPRIPAAENTGQVMVVALRRVVEESFAVFLEVSEASRVLEKRATRMSLREVKEALEICDRAGKTLRDLAGFYGWCRDVGVALPENLQELEFQEINEPETEGERREENELQSEGDKLALALCSEPAVDSATWESFPADEPTSVDWEVALMESAAALARHQLIMLYHDTNFNPRQP